MSLIEIESVENVYNRSQTLSAEVAFSQLARMVWLDLITLGLENRGNLSDRQTRSINSIRSLLRRGIFARLIDLGTYDDERVKQDAWDLAIGSRNLYEGRDTNEYTERARKVSGSFNFGEEENKRGAMIVLDYSDRLTR